MSALRNFQVRDLEAAGGYPGEFDVIFHDDANKVERYSCETFTDYNEALEFAETLEAENAKPVDWDIYRNKN